MYFLVILLSVNASVFCALAKEFPFDLFNSSGSEQNETALKELNTMSTSVSEVIEELTHLEEETNNEASQNLSKNKESSPILSALRSFWAQASVSLMDPVSPISEEPIKAEPVFRLLERELIEATTLGQEEEATVIPSSPLKKVEPVLTENKLDSEKQKSLEQSVSPKKNSPKPSLSEKVKPDSTLAKKIKAVPVPQNRQGDLPNETIKEANNGPTASGLVTNLSLSCSNCYERLNRCVLKCFEDHNCKDVERMVRVCPPTPNRICNMFTQWNPVDECGSHADCSSPLLCCNDGCKNKCLPGIWSS